MPLEEELRRALIPVTRWEHDQLVYRVAELAARISQDVKHLADQVTRNAMNGTLPTEVEMERFNTYKQVQMWMEEGNLWPDSIPKRFTP